MIRLIERWLAPLVYFAHGWVAKLGILLVTSATVLWIFLTGASPASGYLGILQFVALPVAFFAGLALIAYGVAQEKKKQAPDRHLHLPERVDWNDARVQNMLLFLGVATCANLVIGGALTYQTVHYMESTNFCGTACHQVMGPEFAAYKAAGHSNVKCVECHVGEGALPMIQAKVNGTRQLLMVMTGGYSRPIPVPHHGAKTAAQTCLNCHSPNVAPGDRVWTYTKFDDGGARLDTALVLKLNKIHAAHAGIRFWSDQGRTKIAKIRSPKGTWGSGDGIEREMDCLDCHNRPAHTFENPDRAVDGAMTRGEIASSVPFMRTAALTALKKGPANAMPALLKEYFAGKGVAAPAAELDKTAKVLAALYARNVFPEMKVTWGTYPNHIGHTDSPGCFRCHGDELKGAGGQTIAQDCETCHKTLAVEEKDSKVMKDLGL
jgi:hypothetical protein